MYSYFPQSVIRFTNGNRIIKILGIPRVDGKCRHLTQVLTLPDFLGRNTRVDLLCLIFYGLGISIRQTVFGQNGVHFRGIVSALPQYIHDLTNRILGMFGPFGNLHHSLISAFTTFQRFFRNKYVVGQRTVLGEQESKILTHLQSSDKRPVAPFENLDHLRLAYMMLPAGQQSHFHLVSSHGMQRVPFGHKNRFSSIQRGHGIFTVRFAIEYGFKHLPCGIQTEMQLLRFFYIIIHRQIFQQVHTKQLGRMSVQFQVSEYTFNVVNLGGIILKKFH